MNTESRPRLVASVIFVGGFAASIASVAVVSSLLGPAVAVKGTFAPIGILLAVGLYFFPFETADLQLPSFRPALSLKILLVTILTLFASSILFRAPLFASITASLVVLILVLSQIRDGYFGLAVGSLVGLYGFQLIIKILNTGFYFGNFDILDHTVWAEALASSGSLSAALGETAYLNFPILHVTTSIVANIGDLDPYPSLVVVGLLSYSTLIVVVFRGVVAVTRTRLYAALVAVALVLIPPFHFYGLYFFPQSFAFVFSIFALYILVCNNSSIRWKGLFFVIALSLLLTHHLIIVLFVPLFVATSVALVVTRGSQSVGHTLPLLTALVGAVSYWVLVDFAFIRKLTWSILTVFTSGRGGVYAGRSVYALGDVEYHTLSESISWLLGPWGVHAAIILGFFLVGFVTLVVAPLEPPSQRPSFTALPAALGVVGGLFLLDTPLTIKGISRVGMIWIPVFAAVLGLGLYRIEAKKRHSALLVVLVVAAGIAAPLVTAGDYYGMETYSSKSQYTPGEYAELRAVSSFATDYDSNITTFWTYAPGASRFGVETTRPLAVEDGRVFVGQGSFLMTTYWEKSVVLYKNKFLYLDKVLIGDDWVRTGARKKNKIYDSGVMFVIHSSTSYRLGPPGERAEKVSVRSRQAG